MTVSAGSHPEEQEPRTASIVVDAVVLTLGAVGLLFVAGQALALAVAGEETIPGVDMQGSASINWVVTGVLALGILMSCAAVLVDLVRGSLMARRLGIFLCLLSLVGVLVS